MFFCCIFAPILMASVLLEISFRLFELHTEKWLLVPIADNHNILKERNLL